MPARKIILNLFLFCFANIVQSQTVFQRIYRVGGESAATFADQTPDGGFIVVGNGNFLRTDSNGYRMWSKVYPNSKIRYAHQTPDGGYIWGGEYYQGSPNYYDGIIGKSDSSGNVLWANTFGEINFELISSMIVTADGGCILSGMSSDTFAGLPNYALSLFKVDSLGSLQWSKCFRTCAENQVRQTPDGGYIVAGSTRNGCNQNNGCLIKVDSAGNLQWTKDYCDSIVEESTFSDIQVTTDGGYIISGRVRTPNTVFNASSWLVRTDSLGNILWQYAYDGGNFPRNGFYAVQQTTDGGFAASGNSGDFGAYYSDAILVKTNSDGLVLWSKVYGAAMGVNLSVSLHQTMDEGYLLAGHIIPPGSTGGDKYFYVVKTDNNGVSGCMESVAFPRGWRTTFKTFLGSSVDSNGVSAYPVTLNVVDQGTEYDFCTFLSSGPDYSINKNFFQLYPNPVTSRFVISFSETLHAASVKILNALGEPVYERTFSGSQLLIDNELKAGIYLLEITDESVRRTKKFIVQ